MHVLAALIFLSSGTIASAASINCLGNGEPGTTYTISAYPDAYGSFSNFNVGYQDNDGYFFHRTFQVTTSYLSIGNRLNFNGQDSAGWAKVDVEFSDDHYLGNLSASDNFGASIEIPVRCDYKP